MLRVKYIVLWALVCVTMSAATGTEPYEMHESLSPHAQGGKQYLFDVVLSEDSMHRRTDIQKHGLAVILQKHDVWALSEEQLSWFPESAKYVLQSKMSKEQLSRRGFLVQREFVVDGKSQRFEGRIHHFGEGFVAVTATVDHTVYVAKEAAVLDNARALDYVRIQDKALLKGHALAKDYVLLQNRAVVDGYALLSDYAVVRKRAHITDHAQVSDRVLVEGQALLKDHAKMSGQTRASDHAILRGHSQLRDTARVAGYTVMEHYAVAEGSAYFRDGCLGGHACIWGENHHRKIPPLPGKNPEATINRPLKKLGQFCSQVFKKVFRM